MEQNEKTVIKRDWVDLCEKAYFKDYIDEMIELINDNQDEFYEFVSGYLSQWVQKRSDGTYSLFYYFKNVLDYGVKYFINEFLKDDPWYKLEVNVWSHIGMEDSYLFTIDESTIRDCSLWSYCW